MARESKNHFIVILCGGTGPRLWPLSRASHPKQFLEILSPDSLLIQTIKRAQKIVPKENIFLVTNIRYNQKIKDHTGKLIKSDNILIEPNKKNTMMAIVYASAVIKNKNKNAIITTLPSDQYIEDLKAYVKDIKSSANIASNYPLIVTIGFKPTHPNPSYGYIVTQTGKNGFHKVIGFIEKPQGTKLKTILQKNSFWNSGIYTFHLDTFINETAKHSRDYFNLYLKLEASPCNQKTVNKVYSLSPQLPIDKVISEKSKNLAMIKAGFIWSDIGEWKSIHQYSQKDSNGIATLNKTTSVLSYNTGNCLVSTDSKDKIIGMVGVDNLAVIDTGDALLICNLRDSFHVRDLVTQIVSSKKTEKYFLSQANDQRKI
ncbi:MAG: mannose-1-phosphate guanylyltransferase [Patescibacteria group bacterium]|jgi:mannose-1-phosphate guanylyltransferase